MFRVLFWTICSSVVLASPNFLSLDFTRAPSNDARVRRRGLELPMFNDLPHQRYTVNLTIGTPPQPFSITLDTGGSAIWLPASNSSGCPSSGCPPGTFDPTKSSTYKATGVTFNASFGLTPDLQVTGPYFNDTLRIGNATIPEITMAVGDVPKELFIDGLFGILGLGPRLSETTFTNPSSPTFHDPNGTFPTLFDQLQSNGYTKRRAFSIWLNDISATTGRIIFGGIDTTKYHGELISLPVQLDGPGLFDEWAIALTSVARSDSHGTKLLTAKNFGISAILDSGSPNCYVPTALADSISSTMNATVHEGFQYVPCALRKAHDSLTFGFGGPSGPNITVPYANLIYPYGDPANIGKVNAKDGSPLCYLGVIGTPGNIILLGDTFIRSAYLVYDAENMQVAMAPVKYGVSGQNIVQISAGKGLPGVTSTASYMIPAATPSPA